ncbi:hypothetical protein D3C79_619910 [compost metagenome]
MVFPRCNAAQFSGADLITVIRMHAGAETLIAGDDFPDLKTEHGIDGVRPIELFGVDRPVPGANAGKVLAALVALDVFRQHRSARRLPAARIIKGLAAFTQLPFKLTPAQQRTYPQDRQDAQADPWREDGQHLRHGEALNDDSKRPSSSILCPP